MDDRSEHWLWRLDAAAWLRAAHAELEAGRAHLNSRRIAVTHARRGAGMAINAVLVALPVGPGEELRWGRSYLDHLRALAGADEAHRGPLSVRVQSASARLLTLAVAPSAALIQLVQLARGPHSAAETALDLAAQIFDECAAFVATHPARSPA